MKKTMSLAGLLLFVTGIYAQETPVKDKKEETVTTKIVVNNGKTIEKITVKEETTTEKRQVRLKDKDDHYENQNVEYVPTESKKTVRINNNIKYANMVKRSFYMYNGKKYSFTPDKTGFFISLQQGNQQTRIAKIRKTSAKDHFLVTGNNFSGIGYFDTKGNFIIERPDRSGDNMIVQKYTLVQ